MPSTLDIRCSIFAEHAVRVVLPEGTPKAGSARTGVSLRERPESVVSPDEGPAPWSPDILIPTTLFPDNPVPAVLPPVSCQESCRQKAQKAQNWNHRCRRSGAPSTETQINTDNLELCVLGVLCGKKDSVAEKTETTNLAHEIDKVAISRAEH